VPPVITATFPLSRLILASLVSLFFTRGDWQGYDRAGRCTGEDPW
jgi:hypothetical protein